MSEEPPTSQPAMTSRRSFLRGGLVATAVALTNLDRVSAADRRPLAGVKALTFDMQGTVFDFFHPIARVAAVIGQKQGLPATWAAALPGAWSGAAHDIIVGIAQGDRPWAPNTDVYRETLETILSKRGIAGRLSSGDRDTLLARWGNMHPWPDVRAGLTRLRRRFLLSTLTNASMAQMIGLVKRSALPFDAVLTGELNHAFKPNPKVYGMAVDYLGHPPDALLMVSAHKWDLLASKRAGFRTAYIPRPMELGPGQAPDLAYEPFIDIIAADLPALAHKLGC